MFYVETLKRLNEHVKNNDEIPAEDKEKAKKIIEELLSLLALY